MAYRERSFMRLFAQLQVLLVCLVCAGCGDSASTSDAGVGDAGADVAAPAEGGVDQVIDAGRCGPCPCPPGYSCSGGICQDGQQALVPYDLAALRADPSLDVHVRYTAPGGVAQQLAVVGYELACPAARVGWAGEGAYVAELRDDDPWWASAPLALSRSRDYADVKAEGSSASVMAQSYQDMGWGLWQNAIGASSPAQIARRQAFVDAGVLLLGYLEGTGNLFVFLASIDDPPQTMPNTDVTATRFTHWSWGAWGSTFPADQQAIWIGPHTYYDAPSYAGAYTYQHPTFGDAVRPTDPAGQPITPSAAAAADPRQHDLYRQCGATDINGEPHLDLSLQGSRKVDGLPGVVAIDGKSYSILGLARDPACKTWRRYHDVSLRYAVAQGTRGCWMDNVSLWDAFGLVPADAAFGAHTNAGFEAFLVGRAPAGFLARSDLPQHLGAMNARCIVKWKARTGFGDDVGAAGPCSAAIDVKHGGLMDPRWDGDLAWGAYLAYTAELHVEHYQAMQKTLDALDPEFLWGVNDLPNYGAPVGERVAPSMNLSELALGPHILTGGTRTPPEGSLAPLYDLAGAFDRAQFQSVWLYVDEAGLADSPGLHRALAAEALAYDTFLMPSADDPRAPGTTASAGAINAWLSPHAKELEGRRPWAAVGIVFSADSWLRAFRPGGLPSVSVPDGEGGSRSVRDFSHQHAFSGWHLVLHRQQVQAQPLLAGRLKPGDLDGYELVVLPDVQVLSSALRDDVLSPWVNAGGTLIVTGASGRYQGREALYEPWSSAGAGIAPPVGLAALTGIADLSTQTAVTARKVGKGTIVIVPGTPGADAWLGRGSNKIDAVVRDLETNGVLPRRVLVAPPATHALVRLHTDAARGRLFVDLVNRDWDATSGTLKPVGAQPLTVQLPTWLQGVPLAVRTAAQRGKVVSKPGADPLTSLALSVGGLKDIVTVVIEARPGS